MEKDFATPLSQDALDLGRKSRSSVFPWRGQFSPDLVKNILDAYCEPGAVVLDPFCGSGTVLHEAGLNGMEAIGVELNPAAYILSRTYELINFSPSENKDALASFLEKFKVEFPEPEILDNDQHAPVAHDDFENRIAGLRNTLVKQEEVLLDAFVILLDIHNNDITPVNIYSALSKVSAAVVRLPHSKKPISAVLGDSRATPIEDAFIDFVVTSPPYINVFNYHQNYRRSAEVLGWDLLSVARSEIGSNRANRGNRFLTVIQYCLDMASMLDELHRVTKKDGKVVFVVGRESNVLGAPFYNTEIISMIATNSGLFELVLRQERKFKNKFGRTIREDLLHFRKNSSSSTRGSTSGATSGHANEVGREVAADALNRALAVVQEKNSALLKKAIASCEEVEGIPFYRTGTAKNEQVHQMAAEA